MVAPERNPIIFSSFFLFNSVYHTTPQPHSLNIILQ